MSTEPQSKESVAIQIHLQESTADISAVTNTPQPLQNLPDVTKGNEISVTRKREMNPRSLANLAPRFQPGNPGGGRKPDTPMMKELRRLARKREEAKAVAQAAFTAAKDPKNPQMSSRQDFIFDRIEGPVVQESRIAVATIAYVSHLEREET